MRKVTKNDLDRLKDLYGSRSYNDLKVVFSYLKTAKNYLAEHDNLTIESNDRLVEINSAEGFEMWVENSFPIVSGELKKGKKSTLDDSDDFPHFKQHVKAPQNLCISPKFRLLKKLSVWDTEQRVKQNYQKISSIKYDSPKGEMVFNLNLESYLKVEEPGKITESDYSIIIQDSPSVELKSGNQSEVTFLKENTTVKVFSKGELLNSIDCKSIFTNEVEIFK